MSVTTISEFGKTVAELGTVESAVRWSEALQKREFRGLGDTREAARGRVAKHVGIPESWLKRLRYKIRELNDVPGAILIPLAVAYYSTCEAIESRTHELQVERHNLRDERDAAHQRDRGLGHGNRPALA